jgi:hypothetical protein
MLQSAGTRSHIYVQDVRAASLWVWRQDAGISLSRQVGGIAMTALEQSILRRDLAGRQHSPAMIAVSGVIVLGGFDLCDPSSAL